MASKEQINSWFESFNQQNVIVIGDVMLDAYIWGKVNRISPEAPVPVINISKRETRAGGAANVALNLKSLGATTFMVSVSGKDDNGTRFLELMQEAGINTHGVVQDSNRKTTIKTRVIAQGQQLLRADEESTEDISSKIATEILERIQEIIANNAIHAIVLEDYNKGLLTKSLITKVIALAKDKNIPVTVDPKKDNFFAYKGATLFKPNLKELAEGLKIDIDPASEKEVGDALLQLQEKMQLTSAMVTLSEYGVQCLSTGFSERIPAHRREISDVSGAGDTVIAVATLCLALQLPYAYISEFANLAGGLVCEEVGVVPIDKNKLLQEAIKVFHA